MAGVFFRKTETVVSNTGEQVYTAAVMAPLFYALKMAGLLRVSDDHLKQYVDPNQSCGIPHARVRVCVCVSSKSW